MQSPFLSKFKFFLIFTIFQKNLSVRHELFFFFENLKFISYCFKIKVQRRSSRLFNLQAAESEIFLKVEKESNKHI